MFNDGVESVQGEFGDITGLALGVCATVTYNYNATDALGRVGTGNEVAVTLSSTSAIPEPAAIGLVALTPLLLRWRKKAVR